MPQLEHIEAIEKRLWSAADTLRANSNCASNEYFLPVMGLVFLRHAYSRYLAVKDDIVAGLPTRGGKQRALTKEDFSRQSAIFMQPRAQFDHLVSLPGSKDRAEAIFAAMDSIEKDYRRLRGVLPKKEYQEFDNDILGQLLRILNPDELKKISGDVFGRIYEYFLTRFADQKAHDDGEFFTPVSLVSLIAHILEPVRGTVLDPACGSGGMFVQSARTVEEHGQRPADLTFRGMEKNATTIRLAEMNLAVHGLEGDIHQAITYYEDPHELVGKADYVMANPPFNVDEIDADKIRSDPRLPFGLPGVNKKGKVSNGNYIWISYFYSYMSPQGRAGFVMSSQASSAGGGEAKVRQALVETGDVDIMIAIRSNFFYTRTVPCELWFLNRAKPERHRDKVLMLDARNVYRKVSRKICDFSHEQQQNLLAIVWLYRGQTEQYLNLVAGYCARTLDEARACFTTENEDRQANPPLPDFLASLASLRGTLAPFLKSLGANDARVEILREFDRALPAFQAGADAFYQAINEQQTAWAGQKTDNDALRTTVNRLAPLADASRDLAKQTDLLYKLAARLTDTCKKTAGRGLARKPGRGKARERSKQKEHNTQSGAPWNGRDITRACDAAGKARRNLTKKETGKPVEEWGQLTKARYFWRQAHWLTEHFPKAELRDIEGLVKLVNRAEIEDNDWSLTPGRYVGVAPEEVDENFDFEETLRTIHVELEDLNAEAVELAATIKNNFEGLGV